MKNEQVKIRIRISYKNCNLKFFYINDFFHANFI